MVPSLAIDVETLGITQKNVDRIRQQTRKENIRQLLGLEKTPAAGIGLDKEWAYRIIKEVGNYGEIFDRNIGKATPLGISRGLNASWVDGGMMYAPPIR